VATVVDGTVTDTVVGVAALTVGVTADRTDTVCAVTSAASWPVCVRVSESDEVASCAPADLGAVSTSGDDSRVPVVPDPFAVTALSVLASAGCSEFFAVSVAADVLSPVFCWADTVEVGPVDDVEVDVDEEPDVPVAAVVAPVSVVSVVAELSALVDCAESEVSVGEAVATP
jgi:hypothetical protein